MTDAKIIRLISRRVAFFPTAASARQFFDGYCDVAEKKFPQVIPADLQPCRLLGKEMEGFLIDKFLHNPLY